MRDAYDDLRAHQLGVMAGMKAALAGVIQRFDPANVESKVTAASGLSSLLPSTRKAKLWELFQEVYHQLAADAEEDFHAIYGVAFLRAYQEYVAQIDSQGKG
jgi:FHA domain-containing protein